MNRAADALAGRGWEVVDAEPPLLEEAAQLWRRLSTAEMVGAFLPGGLPEPLSDGSTAYFLDNASEVAPFESIEEYAMAWGRRVAIAAAWHAFQAEHPIILGPVSGRRMPRIGFDLEGPAATTELFRAHALLVAVNFLGLPSVAVPTGLDDDGLPTGVQLIGPRAGDHVALAAARDVEAVCGHVRPDVRIAVS